MFAAHVAHADGFACARGERGAGDVAGFGAAGGEWRAWRGRFGPGENQAGAATVDVAARTHAFDNLLPGVAALGEADVGVFQRRFVRDLALVEIGAEPGDAGLQ